MSNTDPAEADSIAAFEALRGEVSLTRTALEGLTAARERIPDYTETLATVLANQKLIHAAVDRIAKAPAIGLTPDAMAAEIQKAGTAARAADARLIHEACDALSHSTGQVDGIVKRGQLSDRQLEKHRWQLAAAMAIGMLIWSVLPGAVARSLPASWNVPQWMAARTLGAQSHEAEAPVQSNEDTNGVTSTK